MPPYYFPHPRDAICSELGPVNSLSVGSTETARSWSLIQPARPPMILPVTGCKKSVNSSTSAVLAFRTHHAGSSFAGRNYRSLWSAPDAADAARVETSPAGRIFALRLRSWSPCLCVSGRRGVRRCALPLPPKVRQKGRVRGPKRTSIEAKLRFPQKKNARCGISPADTISSV